MLGNMAFLPTNSVNASTLPASVSNDAISINKMQTNIMPAYGMTSNTDLSKILHNTTQDNEERAYFLANALPANMPENMPVSDQMQRRLISSMLLDIDSRQCEEIIKAILSNMNPRQPLTNIILNMLVTINSSQGKKMIAQIMNEMLSGRKVEHDQWIREMLPYIHKDCQSEIISKIRSSHFPAERSSMMKFIVENTDLHDQKCMIKAMLPTTNEVMQKNLISSLLANSTPDQRICMIESLLDTTVGNHGKMIQIICLQATRNLHLFKCLVASMLANTDPRHYRGMVETLFNMEGNKDFHHTVLQEVFACLIANMLLNDETFKNVQAQDSWYPHRDEITLSVIGYYDEKTLLVIIGNVEGDYMSSAVKKAIDIICRRRAENNTRSRVY